MREGTGRGCNERGGGVLVPGSTLKKSHRRARQHADCLAEGKQLG